MSCPGKKGKRNYFQCSVKRLSLSDFTRVPNEAPSLFKVFISHIASALEARFTLNRLIRVGVICKLTSFPFEEFTVAKYIRDKSALNSSYPPIPS